jgi:Secretion system C-terminal sorting domain
MRKHLHYSFFAIVLFLGMTLQVGAEGLNDTQSDKVKLGQNYPNPAVGKTYIEIDFATPDATITIYNVLGKLIESRVVTTKLVVLDVSNYIEGIYLYTLESGGEKITKRMNVRK